jgi:hypothetical protein
VIFADSHTIALRRFGAALTTGVGLRRTTRGVNGVLTAFLCVVSGCLRPDFDRAVKSSNGGAYG